MGRHVFLVAAMIMMLAIAGCGDDDKTTMKDVKEKAQKAVDTAVDYSKQQKEKFMKEMDQHWSSFKGDVDNLQDKLVKKSKEAGTKAAAHWEEISADIKAKQDAVSKAYDELSQAGGEAYEKAKMQLEAALADLKAAYEKAAAELQKS